MKENNFSQILAHAPYTLNACSNKEETREFALNTMADDLRRMEYTPNQLYNFHPGSHVGQGVEIGIDFIVKQLNTVLTPDMTTTVLLETMAGKGTEIGRSFEELKEILDGVKLVIKWACVWILAIFTTADMILSMTLTVFLMSSTELSVLTD